MTLTLAPNIEALIGGWLRTDSAITALGAHVGGRTPDSAMRPWIRVTLLAARSHPTISREHLIEYVVQLDCFAGKTATDDHVGQTEAWTLKASARAILASVEGQALDGIVVTQVRFDGDARLPDTTMEPVRERYVLTVTVRAHAVSA